MRQKTIDPDVLKYQNIAAELNIIIIVEMFLAF